MTDHASHTPKTGSDVASSSLLLLHVHCTHASPPQLHCWSLVPPRHGIVVVIIRGGMALRGSDVGRLLLRLRPQRLDPSDQSSGPRPSPVAEPMDGAMEDTARSISFKETRERSCWTCAVEPFRDFASLRLLRTLATLQLLGDANTFSSAFPGTSSIRIRGIWPRQ
jgi:hypothetical protein